MIDVDTRICATVAIRSLPLAADFGKIAGRNCLAAIFTMIPTANAMMMISGAFQFVLFMFLQLLPSPDRQVLLPCPAVQKAPLLPGRLQAGSLKAPVSPSL